MEKETQDHVKKLERILDANPMTYAELWKASGLTDGEFKYALLRVAIPAKIIRKDSETGLYCVPGQERLALEKKIAGSIGNRQKLVLVREAFHEIFMLRLRTDVDPLWKTARRIAERIEPIMKLLKEKDRDFPYSDVSHRAFDYHPEGLGTSPEVENAIRNWQKYCADVLEYCDRRLGDLYAR
jgi:hypothetical protein